MAVASDITRGPAVTWQALWGASLRKYSSSPIPRPSAALLRLLNFNVFFLFSPTFCCRVRAAQLPTCCIRLASQPLGKVSLIFTSIFFLQLHDIVTREVSRKPATPQNTPIHEHQSLVLLHPPHTWPDPSPQTPRAPSPSPLKT